MVEIISVRFKEAESITISTPTGPSFSPVKGSL